MSQKKKVIFDVDTGIDDALSITYAVRSNTIDIIGMTTCFGNVTVEDATRNTNFILDLLGREDIPVYQGSSRSLSEEELDLEVKKLIHGNDGLGNCLPNDYHTYRTNERDAVSFIIDAIQDNPNELTLIFVGPLTNLAKAIRKAPEIIELVKEVIVMGGAVTVRGNITPHAEANIHADPEAAQIIFQSGLPVTLVGLDVTMKTLLPITYVEEWKENNSSISQFFACMTSHYMKAYEMFQPGIGGCGLHDPLTVGVVLDPSFVKTKSMKLAVELEGETRGKTVVNNEESKKEIEVCLEVDDKRFLTHFIETIQLS